MPEDPKKTPPEEIELEPSEKRPPGLHGYEVFNPIERPPEQKFDTSKLGSDYMTQAGIPLSVKQRAERGMGTGQNDPRAGHRKGLGADFSAEQDPITGEEPASVPYSGTIAPKLLGDRSRAQALMDSIGEFIDKYAPLAIQNFPGYARGTIPQPATPNSPERRDPMRGLMSQDKVHELLDALPMMASDKIIDGVRILGNYVWRIHHEARRELRRRAISIAAKQGVSNYDVVKKGVNDRYGRTGEALPAKDPGTGRIIRGPDKKPIKQYQLAQQVDTKGELFKNVLVNMSQEFNADSARVKSDMAVLADAAGALARASGKGSYADAEFLEKVRQFPQRLDPDDDNSPLVQMPPKIVARPPEVPIAPEMQHLHGDYERPKRAKLTFKKKGDKGQFPRRRRLGDPINKIKRLSDLDDDDDKKKDEAFSRFLDTILEWLP